MRGLIRRFRKKDYGYDSGERQTATCYGEIRTDHRNRYDFAAKVLASSGGVGLDCFCGNGYGTLYLARALGARMTGIDGSAEAISVAKTHFSSDRVVYRHELFPFQLPEESYDFIISVESLEHVKDGEGLLSVLSGALKCGGALLVSVPNEDALPLAENRAFFGFHERHYSHADLIAIARSCNLRHEVEAGQNVYQMENSRVIGLLDESEMVLVPGDRRAQFSVHLFSKVT